MNRKPGKRPGNVFGSYARYYNLLYKDKNYEEESEYVDHLIKLYYPAAKTILDLGCGTGRHDFLLAEKGYSVTGIDRSEEMLNIATTERRSRLNNAKSSSARNLEFHNEDIRIARLSRRFDAVVSLFHVFSYLSTDTDLQQTFETIKIHLRPDGIFIFDFWYAPAVLTERPSSRVRYLEDEKIRVTRIAEPVMHVRKNIVDVNYQILIQDKTTGKVEELRECHPMRYLSEPEIELFLSRQGLEIIEAAEFMTRKPLDVHTWNACVVAGCKKKESNPA